MNKLKKVVGVLLCACIVASLAAFTACGKGDDSLELQAGEQVASEAEWKQAFDSVLNADSFTVKTVGECHEIDSTNENDNEKFEASSYIDLKNSKALIDITISEGNPLYTLYGGSSKNYFEVRENVVWYSMAINGSDWEAHPHGEGEQAFNNNVSLFLSSQIIFQTHFLTSDNFAADPQSITELFSMFTYSNGYYVADLYHIGVEAFVTVSITNGCVSGMKCIYKTASGIQGPNISVTTTCKITNINSTTVTAPAGATEAIDAAIQNKNN